MKDEIKIDIAGSIRDVAGKVTTAAFGTLLVLVLFGCLIAPIFYPLFESYLIGKYDINHHYERIPMVRKMMGATKIALWAVAIASWAFVIGSYKGWIVVN
jgi:hypothetical protein